MTSLEAYQKLKGYIPLDWKETKLIEEDLILLNALRNKLIRKVETKEYKYEASNSYRISTLLTYELKEYWDDMELHLLKQFLLNLSGISKDLKALEIIKKYIVLENDEDDEYELFPYHFKAEQYVSSGSCKVISKQEYEILKEVLG